MKKILTLGSATQDIFIFYEGAQTMRLHTQKSDSSFLLLESGVKVDIPEPYFSTGGGALNAAIAMKRLGIHTQPCVKVGKDSIGNYILQELTKEKIDISLIKSNDQIKSARSYIIPTLDSNNSALCYRGSHIAIDLIEIPFDASYATFYITSLHGHGAELLPAIAQQANQLGITIATNPGSNQLIHACPSLCQALPHIQTLIVNAHEAQILMHTLLEQEYRIPLKKRLNKDSPSLLNSFIFFNNQEYTLVDYIKRILEFGVTHVVVTNGAEGVYVGIKDKIYFHPSIAANVITGIGAGDAFGSTFVGCLTLGLPIETALYYGVLNASSVITFIDTKTGLLTLEELQQKANNAHTVRSFII